MSRQSFGGGGGGSSKPSGPAYRSAPDSHSFQKNQKFHVSDGASASASLVSNVPLLKPVFARDVVVAPKASTRVEAAAAPAPVQSSRTMKASAPVSRAPVQVIDAGQMLKRFDADAIAMRAPKVKTPKVKAAPEPSEEEKRASAAADRASFAVTSAEVESLGASALNKWDRKSWEAEEEKAQGLRPAKRATAPFKMYLGMEAKKEERAKRRRESDREQGLQVRAESSISAAKKARMGDASEAAEEAGGGWKMNIGKSHRGGVLSLYQHEIQNIRTGGRGRDGPPGAGGRGGRGGGRGGGGGRGRGRGRGR